MYNEHDCLPIQVTKLSQEGIIQKFPQTNYTYLAFLTHLIMLIYTLSSFINILSIPKTLW